jgi:hypothetical protein
LRRRGLGLGCGVRVAGLHSADTQPAWRVCECRRQRDGVRGEQEAARRCASRRRCWHCGCPAGGRGSQRFGGWLGAAAVGCIQRLRRRDRCAAGSGCTCGLRGSEWQHAAHQGCYRFPHRRRQRAAGCGRGCASCEQVWLHGAALGIDAWQSGRRSRTAGSGCTNGCAQQARQAAYRHGVCATLGLIAHAHFRHRAALPRRHAQGCTGSRADMSSEPVLRALLAAATPWSRRRPVAVACYGLAWEWEWEA